MEPWHLDDQATIYHGDCLEVLRELPDASVDSVVTDPPYGLEFMGKEWDKFSPTPMRKRSGWDTADSGAGIDRSDLSTPHGRTGVAFHKRRSTYKCDSCGKRDAFRNPHDCTGTWRHEWVDELPVEMLTFQAWCQEWAAECLRVLKPGGHLLAFGGTRTWHRLAVAIEDAGFEIRDSIAWMYGSGFPKSLDVSKAIDKAAGAERTVVGQGTSGKTAIWNAQGGMGTFAITSPSTPDAARWQGWGTALKPAHEPVVVARKPLTGTVAGNVLEHGTGALNIDGCRIASTDGYEKQWDKPVSTNIGAGTYVNPDERHVVDISANKPTGGRWPANVVLDEDQAAALDQQSGQQRDGVAVKRNLPDDGYMTGQSAYQMKSRKAADIGYGGGGGASRFFYVAKAPARERPKVDGVAHPTVKPLTLMRWLCRLVTPPGGTVLEPFAGSGTTIEAALMEGFRVVAIEREPDYLPLIAARLERVNQEPDDGQLTFDASA